MCPTAIQAKSYDPNVDAQTGAGFANTCNTGGTDYSVGPTIYSSRTPADKYQAIKATTVLYSLRKVDRSIVSPMAAVFHRAQQCVTLLVGRWRGRTLLIRRYYKGLIMGLQRRWLDGNAAKPACAQSTDMGYPTTRYMESDDRATPLEPNR